MNVQTHLGRIEWVSDNDTGHTYNLNVKNCEN